MKKTAFEKRIKRRIIAQEHTFFASCAPGLKTLLENEILNLNLKTKKNITKKGGVEFFGKIHDCYRANLNLRCPGKILMRVAQFKAENFSTLEKKLEQIDWELLLQKNAKLNFHVSTKKSRLYHTNAIAQRADKVISQKLLISGNPLDNDGNNETRTISHEIFIRTENDYFQISLDSSGELLHKRCIKQNTTHAPIRENLAFAVLFFAGFTKNDVLIDPMCGSGTFSLEASMLKQNIPPGFFRKFAFQSWPCFKKEKWEYLKKQAENQFDSGVQKQIFASDIDSKAISSLEKNLQRHNFDETIDIKKQDFFNINQDKFKGTKGVIVLNPPYGKRLGKSQDISAFYREIGKKLEKDFKGWRAGIIMPEKRIFQHYTFQESAIRSFYHGGLDIFLLTGII